TPFDRILATRLAARCIEYLEEHIDDVEKASVGIGLIRSAIRFTRFDEMSRMMDDRFKRPKEQWWLNLRPIARVMAQPAPGSRTSANGHTAKAKAAKIALN
ncbi:MAG: hypothetical protein KDE04_25350, partial [Anaerolineales bacterium]|nr:hypothetical protein [Anaerolineales bacterium]